MSGYTNNMDRNDYDIGASQTAQENFDKVAKMLEAALDTQGQQVNTLMSRYEADGSSAEYQQLSGNWDAAGFQVRAIIGALRGSLEENDRIASNALAKAAASVFV